MTDDELDDELRHAFADARLSPGRLAELVAMAEEAEPEEPLIRRRLWDRWVIGLSIAAVLALAIWPTVGRQVGDGEAGAGLAPAPEPPPAIVVAPPETVLEPYESEVPDLRDLAAEGPVPSGMRAVGVPSDLPLPSAIVPGSEVDVFVSLETDGEAETLHLLERVRVVGLHGDRSASVAVTPQLAEKLVHAINVGSVRLAARTERGGLALTVPVAADALAGGVVVPRAFVDVAYEQPDTEPPTRLSLVRDATVLETGTERGSDGSLQGVVTVEVPVDAAASVAHAMYVGRVALIAR